MQDLSPNAKKLVAALSVGALIYAGYRIAKGDTVAQATEKTVKIPIKVGDTVIEVIKDATEEVAAPVKKAGDKVVDAVVVTEKKARKPASEKQIAARKRFAEMNKGRKGRPSGKKTDNAGDIKEALEAKNAKTRAKMSEDGKI